MSIRRADLRPNLGTPIFDQSTLRTNRFKRPQFGIARRGSGADAPSHSRKGKLRQKVPRQEEEGEFDPATAKAANHATLCLRSKGTDSMNLL